MSKDGRAGRLEQASKLKSRIESFFTWSEPKVFYLAAVAAIVAAVVAILQLKVDLSKTETITQSASALRQPTRLDKTPSIYLSTSGHTNQDFVAKRFVQDQLHGQITADASAAAVTIDVVVTGMNVSTAQPSGITSFQAVATLVAKVGLKDKHTALSIPETATANDVDRGDAITKALQSASEQLATQIASAVNK